MYEDKNIKGGSGGPKLKKKIKMVCIGGGIQRGGVRRDFFSKVFPFQNRAQGSGRVSRGDNFPPLPGGDPPRSYAQDGSVKFGFSRIFNLTKKSGKKSIFTKSFPLLYFDSLGPILAFHVIVFARCRFLKPWYASQNDQF